MMEDVKEGNFTPNIIYRGEEPVEYGVFLFQQYGPEYHSVSFDSVSSMLETYYASKNILTRIRQKSADLRKIVQTALERNRKKLILQLSARNLQTFVKLCRLPWNATAKS